MLLTTHLVCLKYSIFYYQTSDFTTTKLTFIASDTKIQTHVLKIVGCTLYICATNVTATLNVIGMKWESALHINIRWGVASIVCGFFCFPMNGWPNLDFFLE